MFQSKSFRPFIKTTQQYEKKPSASDTLMEVVSYDLEKYAINAKRVSDGKILSLRVKREKVEAGRKSETEYRSAKWFGHLIDKRMEAIIPVGDKFVAERTEFSGKFGGSDCFECTRIHSLPDQSEGKILEGIVTVSAYKDNINFMQVWEPRSYSYENLMQVGKMLDDVCAEREAGGRPNTIGFQFRLIKGDSVVEQSACYDYIPAERDGETVIKPASLFDSKKFYDVANEFREYADSVGAKAEVMIYRNYMTSKFNNFMESNRSAAYMAKAQVKLSPESDGFIEGKCWAVRGIAAFTEDQYDKKAKAEVKRNLVQKLFVSGVAGSVQAWVRTSDGQKVTLSSALKIYKDRPAQEGNATSKAFPVTPELPEDEDLFESMDKDVQLYSSDDDEDPFAQ